MTDATNQNCARIGIVINRPVNALSKKRAATQYLAKDPSGGAQRLCNPLALRSRVCLQLPAILNRCKDSKDFGIVQAKSV